MEQIKFPDLSQFKQPPWNDASSVHSALASIWAATDESSSEAAYDRLLYAVGNNHAGTYYSVALAILPGLEVVLQNGGAWSQYAALEALIDFSSAFRPEPGEELHDGLPLQQSLNNCVLKLAPLIRTIAKGADQTATSAQQLLDLIPS